jgi:hypothetical protein
MINVTAKNNSNANANTKQESICFCFQNGTEPQRPSVSLQLSDPTKSFRA